MKLYDTMCSYIDLETMEENIASVKGQGGGKLGPEGDFSAGTVYAICYSGTMIDVAKIDSSLSEKSSEKFDGMVLNNSEELKESVKTAQNYFIGNTKHISQIVSLDQKDSLTHVEDCMGIGIVSSLSLATYVSYIASALGRPLSAQLMVLGSMSIGGTLNIVDDLANGLQVSFDAGTNTVLLHTSSAAIMTLCIE